jgi:type II secretory pathway pseudopilin PulG
MPAARRDRPTSTRLMPRGGQRSALTLLELLLALLIIVALFALAAPSMHRTWERYRVKAAGDQLRAALSRAHVKAMRDGQIQVVRCELGGARYTIEPWFMGDEMINASAQEAFNLSQPQIQMPLSREERLPEEVTFVAATAKFDLRAMEVEELAMSQLGAQVQWSQPILFYPDGTSSQAAITLANKRGEAVQVRLRKLTGLTSVSDITTVEALAAEELP